MNGNAKPNIAMSRAFFRKPRAFFPIRMIKKGDMLVVVFVIAVLALVGFFYFTQGPGLGEHNDTLSWEPGEESERQSHEGENLRAVPSHGLVAAGTEL